MPDGPNKNHPSPPLPDPSKPEAAKPRSRLIIEAPEYLAYGQNLYDQEPFSGVIQNLQARLDLSGEGYTNLLRFIIRDCLTDLDLTKPSNDSQAGIPVMDSVTDKVIWLMGSKNLRTPVISRVSPNQKPRIGRQIAKEVLGLLEYPSIDEYISDLGPYPGSNSYDRLGQFMIRHSSYYQTPTRTYAKWLFDRAQREGRMLSLEVRSLVFGTEETTPQATVVKSGHRSGWKKWAILKASEITNPHP